MKHWQFLVAFLLASFLAGTACAYPATVYRERVVVAQQPTLVRAGTMAVQQPPQARQRRFVMPPNAPAYQRGGPQYMAPPATSPRATRMTLEERRALRQQINDANRGIYRRNGARVVQH